MYCPKCGYNKFGENSQKSFHCSKCGFLFYFNAAAAVVGIIFNDNNEVLLTTRKHDPFAGMLDFPGGFIEYNESAEEGLKRELKEELNVDVCEMNYFATLPNIYTYAGVTYHTLDIAYICHIPNLTDIKPDDDITDFSFVKPEQIDLNKIGLNSPKEFIKLYINQKSRFEQQR